MLASFAALEARTNAAIVRNLSNRVVMIGALGFEAIFEDVGTELLDGNVATTEPRLMAVPSAIVASLARGTTLTVMHPITLVGELFEFVRGLPDGSGFHVVYLRKPEPIA